MTVQRFAVSHVGVLSPKAFAVDYGLIAERLAETLADTQMLLGSMFVKVLTDDLALLPLPSPA